MSERYQRVKEFVQQMELQIDREDEQDELVVVSDERTGINHLVIDCEDQLVILEQYILELPEQSSETLVSLLQMNRNLVHGAFVLDETGQKVMFRDTLQIENLDFNELEASVNALRIGLAEYASELISFTKQAVRAN